jgi:uroporphyrinogen III methyltransferase/synthase
VSAAEQGRVYLVGAGPGDPGLLTLRGAELLGRADVVVYDALASLELLDLAPAVALRLDVGKRGHDAPTRPQAEITALLIRLAREGHTVVRLKGGDPFVFGRGGEECSALAAANVEFEVVPGVSSVVGGLAYAGIPLTDRRHSASFAVVTGHKDPSKAAEQTRWGELATAADTLVVLMGMRNLPQLVERILAGGRSADTPAAAVMEATLPSQRVVCAPLALLPERVHEAGLGAPALIVVGDVVELRDTLAWVERRPLHGKRVLVTRPREQTAELAAALRERGADPLLIPLLELAAPEDWAPVDAALAAREDYAGLVLASSNAVRAFAARANERGVALDDAAWRVCCVGPRTAAAARAAGLPVHLVPERHAGVSLAAAIAERCDLTRGRWLLPRAAEGRDELPDALRAAGAEVDVVSVYRTLPAPVDAAVLRARLISGEIDGLTFASPSAVKAFAALLDSAARDASRLCAVAAIGRTTAEALRVAGLRVDAVAENAGVEPLVEALIAALGGESADSEEGANR